MEQLTKTRVARWESRGGKHWLELYRDELGYTYRSSSGGGNLGNLGSDPECAALAYMSEILTKRWLGSLKLVHGPSPNP
jgi:hypothetical protein